MLFIEIIEKYNDYVKEAVDELFLTAFFNQINDTDLLLILQNALKNNLTLDNIKRLKSTPYQIGPGSIGFRYDSFYRFINQYRSSFFKKGDHKAELEKSFFQRDYIYMYLIENELLIYMKFWETDLVLRRLLNLSRLARGLNYNWEYKQSFFNNRRKLVKEEILKDMDKLSPKFYQLIEEIYCRQLRNAIAHSQYYFMYDSINLTNKNENSYYKLDSISFEDWEVRFHKNILLYNHLIRCSNEYSPKYQNQAKGKHNGLLVIFPETDHRGYNKTGWLKYDESFNRWHWDNK